MNRPTISSTWKVNTIEKTSDSNEIEHGQRAQAISSKRSANPFQELLVLNPRLP